MTAPNPVPALPTDAMRRDLSIARQLFLGDILEENLFPYPRIRERDREMLAAMTDAIDSFLDDKRRQLVEYDRQAEQPPEFIQSLREMGLFGLIIPEAHGGLELSNGAYARVLTQTSSHDSSVSLTIGAHSSIGMKGLLLFGSDEQKQRYLPRLASGEMIAAFCLTESGAGSDAASIRTRAIRNADGSWTWPLTPASSSGYTEGNASQYTWMVTYNFASLIAMMGGPQTAAQRLDHHFTQLNGGLTQPYFYIGNEPEHGVPWAYNYARKPAGASAAVRRVMNESFTTGAGGLPVAVLLAEPAP